MSDPQEPETAAISLIERLRGALTCRHGYSHYCPNCGNSIEVDDLLSDIADALTRGQQAWAKEVAPLTAWMSAETTGQRDEAFLRMYAAKLRDGTAASWEIPNTVASTLEDVASRLGAAEPSRVPRAQEPGTETLRAFACAVLDGYVTGVVGDLDGGWLQDKALELGLLVESGNDGDGLYYLSPFLASPRSPDPRQGTDAERKE